ncbi:MAG: type IX secretion system protein PorQ [Muribaculaceae bacterium]|nr:type IX secretion system protein PorQ [Muribaculaceae bacterium]
MKRLFCLTSPYTRLLCCLAALWVSISSMAQTGNSGYSFLEIPSSAHSFALGGSGIAVIDDDVTLSEQNPALLGPEIESQLAFNYMLYMGTSNFAGVRYGMGAGEHGAWAAGIRYLNYGKMRGFNESGGETGYFTPQDIVFEGAYSHDINDRLRGGANLKMIYSIYEQYSAFALAVDLGINYYNEENDLSFSAVFSNMGGQLKRFSDSYTRLPFNISLGYMQGLGSSPFSIAITATDLTRWKRQYYSHKTDSDDSSELKSSFFSDLFRHIVFGLQYSPSEKFYAALAYNYKVRTDMSTYQRNFLSGFSVGLGFRVSSFRVGVSYQMPHKGASSLNLNLTTDIASLFD